MNSLNKIINESNSIFNEITSYSSSEYKISIGVFNDIGNKFQYDPYFKIINADNMSKASKIARVRFKDLTYIIHSDKYKHWDLNKKDIKLLNNIIRLKGKSNNTVWEDLLNDVALILNLDSKEEFIEKYKPDYMHNIPDLNNIHYASNIDWNRAKQKGIGN